MENITVILNGYLRPDFLSTQIDAIKNQTIKPAEIMIWINSEDGFDDKLLEGLTVAKSNKNLGVWARFSYALNAKTEYVCIFDDDTIPGKKWLENCLETIKTHEGLLGTIGLIYDNPHNYLNNRRVGWDNPNEETTRVDIVGHAWFFKREWLSSYWRELPPKGFDFVGEDMHFSYTIQKYLGLNTYVPPHPVGDVEMWGSRMGWNFGNVNPTSALPGRMQEMNSYYNILIEKGFKIIKNELPCVENNINKENNKIMDNIEILEFRKININDFYDERFNDGYAWSRVYEYPLVLKTLDNYFNNNEISIHNTSWGSVGVHITFKNVLDLSYPNSVHSDIIPSSLDKTFIYDITSPPNDEMFESFDAVINVSTVEEVSHNHLNIIDNLLKQVKKNGLLVITFDLPGLQVTDIEDSLGVKLSTSDLDISGINSKLINPDCGNLNCGIMVIKKI
jgi:hypothetical protein